MSHAGISIYSGRLLISQYTTTPSHSRTPAKSALKMETFEATGRGKMGELSPTGLLPASLDLILVVIDEKLAIV